MKKIGMLLLSAALMINQIGSVQAASMPDWLNTPSTVQTTNSSANSRVQSTMPSLTNIRYGNSVSRLRIVMDMTAVPQYNVVKENNNTRLVVNINGASSVLKKAPYLKASGIKDVIFADYGSGTLQLIVDMPAALDTKVYTLKNPNRLVVDIQKEYEQSEVSTIAAGLTLTKYVCVDGRGIITAYALTADRKSFNLELALAGDSISSGRKSVKNIALGKRAAAAVNGGYFAADGSLIGNTRIAGQTAGTTYYSRTSLGIMPDGTLKFAPSDYYGEVDVNGQKVYLAGVNCPRGENATILYNSLFGSRTGTNEFGKEYVIKDNKVITINQANSFIPAGGQVISVHGTAQNALSKVKIGDKIVVSESFGKELDAAKNIIGAGPELLRNNMVNVTASKEQFPSDIARGRAPRTALGTTADGKIVLLVIDGRQSHSIGATLTETAQLLQKFGAVNGFNLDGGGSSEMVVGSTVINSPSDGRERPVGSAILLIQK